MLVVLVLFAVLAGAVALSLPSARRSTSAEAAASTFATHLDRAVDIALATGGGFGVARENGHLSFVQRGDNSQWVPHSDKHLAKVKLSVDAPRTSLHAQEVFSVSADLIPNQNTPLRAVFGRGAGAMTVVFDGARVRLQEGA